MSKGRREDQPPGSLSQGANAEQEPWIKPTDNYYRQRLDEITGGGKFERLTNQLRLVTHPRLKHPLRILALDGNMPVEDIPLAATSYQHATFRAATEPQSRDGNVYTRAVRLGYDINFEFRRILPINYIRLNDTRDQVEEVGLGSELAVEYFQHHVFGRDLSEQTRERMRHVQETIFDALRNNPQAQAELASFVTSRKWPYGLAEKARLAYYDPRLTFTIKEEGQEKEVGFMHWAKAQGFTNEEMYLTGWYDLSFSNSGQPTYTPRDAHVIRIPFFKDGRIEVWRTRNLREKRAASHKYTSWPLDRSINRELTASEKLYNGWRLDEARGKMLVLTEGEFKCLVATETTGTFTVGIPGITEVDETIIQAIAKAGVWGVTVVLDRDPQGKGMMRVDGITDSERAAYAIALQLRAAGVSNVRVGQIPDIRGGEKVGLDDLILDNGPQAMNVLLNRAVTPEQYARDINLNPVFFDIWRARQQANKVVEQYENSARRGGSIVAPAIYEQAVQMRDELQELYEPFLVNRFRGARHIDQP